MKVQNGGTPSWASVTTRKTIEQNDRPMIARHVRYRMPNLSTRRALTTDATPKQSATEANQAGNISPVA